MGARPKPPLPVIEPRWVSKLRLPRSWTGGDVECDVVVMGTGAGGAVVGHGLAARGHAVVFVEEGELYHRHSFDGSMVRGLRALLPAGLRAGERDLPGASWGGWWAARRR